MNLTLQQKVDTSQAFLDLDDCRSEGLAAFDGQINRQKCLEFLASAKRQGVVPGEGRFAIGKSWLAYIGGSFSSEDELTSCTHHEPVEGADN